MATEKKIKVFQNLFLRGGTDRAALRSALIRQAAGPWSHSKEKEEELARNASTGADIIVFEREASDRLDGAGVFLWSRGNDFEVTNIVPRFVSELDHERYNAVLSDFVRLIAEPATKSTGYRIERSAEAESLSDWLSGDAALALQQFSTAANKSTGSSHPYDRDRWFAFLFKVREQEPLLSTDLLLRWLIEVESWPEDVAHKLAVEYETGLALLEKYDQYR
jgi:hypothetical protein